MNDEVKETEEIKDTVERVANYVNGFNERFDGEVENEKIRDILKSMSHLFGIYITSLVTPSETTTLFEQLAFDYFERAIPQAEERLSELCSLNEDVINMPTIIKTTENVTKEIIDAMFGKNSTLSEFSYEVIDITTESIITKTVGDEIVMLDSEINENLENSEN